jgi:hypothetical protein
VLGQRRKQMKSAAIVTLLAFAIGCQPTENKPHMLRIPERLQKFFRNKPATRELIAKTEKELGVIFPPQLREFYLLHNGYGYTPFVEQLEGLEPEPTNSLDQLEFSFSENLNNYDPNDKHNVEMLTAMASCYDTDPSIDFHSYMSVQERRRYTEVPAWLLVIGLCSEAESTQLCISLREEDYGTIYFYNVSLHWEMTEEDFEEDPLMPLWFVSPSLQDFLDNLHIDKVY